MQNECQKPTLIGNFLPFHSILYVSYANKSGIGAVIESRIFGVLLSKKTILPLTPWEDLSHIEFTGSGSNARLVAYPKEPNLFRKPIWTLKGEKHWQTGENGSLLIDRGAGAEKAYQYFRQHCKELSGPENFNVRTTRS